MHSEYYAMNSAIVMSLGSIMLYYVLIPCVLSHNACSPVLEGMISSDIINYLIKVQNPQH